MLGGGATPTGCVEHTSELSDVEPPADLAWVISADRQRNGYAGEEASAFAAWLKTTRNPVLTAHIHPANAGSARVAERIGLVPTGELDGGEVVWSDATSLRTTQ